MIDYSWLPKSEQFRIKLKRLWSIYVQLKATGKQELLFQKKNLTQVYTGSCRSNWGRI